MIVAIVEKIIRPKLEAVAWLDTFAGITIRAERSVKDRLPEIFPVSVFTNEDCAAIEPIVVPDRNKGSWGMIEISSDVTRVDVENTGRFVLVDWTQRLRFIFWLNGAKLGTYEHLWSVEAQQEIMRVLTFTNRNPGDCQGLPLVSVKSYVDVIVLKDHRQIFANYSFANDAKLFLKPYDYFAMDVDITWRGGIDCISDFVASAYPILCPPVET